MDYIPGLHIIGKIKATNNTTDTQENLWQKFIGASITQYNLQQVGEVFHVFQGGGFTAVHCLTESHIAVHTWPEFGIVTFDVFLCNYSKDNTQTTEQLAEDIRNFFGGEYLQLDKINR